jgi:hypothetical protein
LSRPRRRACSTSARPQHCDPDKLKFCATSTTYARHNIAESEKELEPPPKHCPEQREEARDPSTARRISSTFCSMTRASSSKARACDIQFFCQTIFALASFEKEHETSATPRSVAGGAALTLSPRYFSRTDLSSPEGSTRRTRHRGPRSCPD